MKLRSAILLVSAALFLSACNFTLAADITPPPDYIPPTPMPTLGPLYPPQAPDVQQGAAVFADHCVACHGITVLGDGPMRMRLPVAVPAIGLPDVARSATPADWLRTVNQGNLERGMPPFIAAL